MKSVSKYFQGYRLVITVIVLLIYVGSSMCNTSTIMKAAKDVYGANDDYIGSQTCITCHKETYDSYAKTPHYNTSAWMNSAKLSKALYKEDSVIYSNNLYVSVHKKTDGFYQSAYSRGVLAASHRIDMVIGSGKKGQSFLFKGKLITDSARTQIVMMEKKEDHLLSLRIKEKQTEEKLASAFILIFSLFSLAVLVYSFLIV